jgi:hypothetical protein
MISRALQLNVFDKPVKKHFFNNLIGIFSEARFFLNEKSIVDSTEPVCLYGEYALV